MRMNGIELVFPCVRERFWGGVVCVRRKAHRVCVRKAHRVCVCVCERGREGSQGVCREGEKALGGVHQILPYVCKRERERLTVCVCEKGLQGVCV